MKKKIMIAILITVFFSFIVSSILFIIMGNYKYIENTKENLKNNNKLVINILKNNNVKDKKTFFQNFFKDKGIRITYINKTGIVLNDSINNLKKFDNHNDREEIIDARKNRYGYAIRYSESTNRQTMYFATSFENGNIIRSSIYMKKIKGFEYRYYKYYIFVLILVLIFAFIISSRLCYYIVKPIKNLQFVTSRIANGELDKRVNILSKDEIGQLGNTFNDMANKLQSTLKEVLNKQDRLQAILKSMDSGVIAVDKNMKVIIINPYAKKLFGIKQDIIGENLMDNIRDFQLESIFKEKEEGYKEIRIIWPKNKDLRIRTADIISGYEMIGKVAVVQDVTDIKKLESMRTQFVANVSHELKTPLTSIKGFAETLKYVEDTINKEKFLNIIDDEVERLTRLINDILILSDIENHNKIDTEIVQINSIIKDVYNLMKHTADTKNIKLTLKEEKNIIKVLGNKDKIKQMLINLVDNAIKYSENNQSVIVGVKIENNHCVIWVKDTGVGISKEHISRLFERFYRVDKARSRAQGGTGLGLAIVKHIVISLKGTIKVESELGKGSNFIVTIPLIK